MAESGDSKIDAIHDEDHLWPVVRQDARTQAEVARIIFGNALTGAAVTYPAMPIVAWVYHGTVNFLALYGVIALTLCLQTVMLLHWSRYQKHVKQREAAGQWDWSVQQLSQASAMSFGMVACISALALVVAHSSLLGAPMIASVMVLIYLVGATVADFIHRPAVIGYPIVLLGPMGVLHAVSGQPAQWAIAGFFVFYFVGVLSYSSMYSKRLQLSIYQKFQLNELAKKLEGERERAQAAHDAKVRFFAATSHDVRQPLQAMSMLLEALRIPGADDAQRLRVIHDLDVNMDALHALFEQVLEVSRLQAGSVQLQPRAVALNELFARLQARFEMLARNKGVRLRFGSSLQAVWADPLALERMVANLLGNAIKHTPQGAAVWVGWRHQRQRIEVRDGGAGIEFTEQSRIFDEFYQVHQSKDHTQGLGLGLAIVKRLAALGGQTLGMQSALGRGSTFWIKLECTVRTEKLLPVIMPSNLHHHDRVVAAEAKTTGRLNLLYVENDSSLLRLTSSLLRMNGWEVQACQSSHEAMAWLLAGNTCHLLLTDFRMGDQGNGAQLIEAVRQLPQFEKLPAIVLTGDGAVAELASMARLRAQAPSEVTTRLLHKPVKIAELLKVMRDCLPRIERP
ncbi:MAG: hybrid sensor histidine kinase/response regulator [Brachymonas sp.]|nr:hybrid sensor histidine kinase/response regulator [Brachymonas sp.]